jgi:hypothetical protein
MMGDGFNPEIWKKEHLSDVKVVCQALSHTIWLRVQYFPSNGNKNVPSLNISNLKTFMKPG